ncbi:ATP-binding protein [Hoeflea sp. G2-23]|uniref:ATP-binding protein n=1 Tax=Hoeflea algicola TaxID=2983763 RepID=A0ABT3ZFL9_9HYPH|nr:ATP-binding protein [Hoeflea algicola]MCY0150596.1 ATP-binding protein [Hoeflea algicola]MCY0150916.1 ATP-binding protein [Hoeflea algicola]
MAQAGHWWLTRHNSNLEKTIMAISLSDLETMEATDPPRMLFYGRPGMGKTSIGVEFPRPVVFQVEDGSPGDIPKGIPAFRKKKLTSYQAVCEGLAALYEGDHDRKTVVIDSVTELQKLIYDETCARGDDEGNTYARMEDFPFNKGYMFATTIWQEFIAMLDALRNDRGMAIVLIAHAAVQEHHDPESQAYDQYQIALHSPKKGDQGRADHRALVERWLDAIICMKRNVIIKAETKSGTTAKNDKSTARIRASGGEIIMMRTVGKPSINAKNRYGIPPDLRYDKGQGFAALAPYLPGFDETKPAVVEDAEEQKDAA